MTSPANNCSFIGNLGKDPDMRMTPAGMAIVNFNIAVTDPTKKKDDKNATLWMRCVIFGKSAETAKDFLSKGSKVGVTGKLQSFSYEKDGETKSGVELIVDGWTKLSFDKKEASETASDVEDTSNDESDPF